MRLTGRGEFSFSMSRSVKVEENGLVRKPAFEKADTISYFNNRDHAEKTDPPFLKSHIQETSLVGLQQS